MKKYVLPWIVLLLCAIGAAAQVRVTGFVKDNKGRTISGISITLKGTYDGAVTDSAGKFSFRTMEKGQQVLVASSMGYKTAEQNILLDKARVEVNFSLKEEVSELKAVIVTAGSFEAGDKKRAATVLSSLDVYTTGGANADITAAVKTLPGAQQVGEQEGLFVRGGTGSEAKQFIDGTVVNNPFFSSVPDIAQRGRFAPNLFKGTVFSTGGYSALYGQALSAALILESIDLPLKSEANFSVSTVFTGGGFQQLAKNKKSSWGANYGYTNLFLYFKIIKQKPDFFTAPTGHSADFNYRFKTKKGGMLKYYTSFAANQIGLRRNDIDSLVLKNAFGLNNTNWYNNLSFRESIGRGWKMNLGFGFSTNIDKINQHVQNSSNQSTVTGISYIDNKNFNLKSTQGFTQLRAVFDKKLSGISVLRLGAEHWYAVNKNSYNGFSTVLRDHLTSVFGEADLYITNAIAAKVGLRTEHSSIINKTNIAPRLSMAYKTGKGAQVSVAYGEFYQKPENMQLMASTQLGYMKATHYIANYQKVTALQTFRIEMFYKHYADLVKTSPALNNSGSGYAQGIELFFRDKKTIKNLDYWISYSFLDTKRDFLNYPERLNPSFAAKHTLSVVAKRWITKINTGFNFTYSYATGRPYYNFLQNNTTGKYFINDKGRTIDYHNLGFSANKLVKMGKASGVFVASVTNVLGSKQIFGYNYNYKGTYKQAIEPVAPRFVFLGLFLSWGVDRTQDAINNNL